MGRAQGPITEHHVSHGSRLKTAGNTQRPQKQSTDLLEERKVESTWDIQSTLYPCFRAGSPSVTRSLAWPSQSFISNITVVPRGYIPALGTETLTSAEARVTEGGIGSGRVRR